MLLSEIIVARPLGGGSRTSAEDEASDRDQPSAKENVSLIDSIEVHDLVFLQNLVSNLDIPQVNLPEKFGVQDAAPRWNRHEDQGAPYLLGSGTTCTVIQHEMDEITSEIVLPGTIVALKLFKHKQPYDPLTDRDLAHIVWQDLRVLSHPKLRGHENICQLLFIGWLDHSVVPALGFELAAYGSLRDALESEFCLSEHQKCHLSFDIAIGLHALHGCGLVHGDLKPENIMIQRHASRRIVAKLLDFAGATDETRFGSAKHLRFSSRPWLPPEALYSRNAMDWRKQDVYAYGMLVTHIFSDIDFRSVGCYLFQLTPDYFTSSEKNDLQLYYKSCPEASGDSLLAKSLDLTNGYSNNTTDGDSLIPLETIQKRTLVVDPTLRASFEDIVRLYRDFALRNQRELPTFDNTKTAFELEQDVFRQLSDTAFFIFNEKFKARTTAYQRTLLRYMIQISGPPQLSDISHFTIPRDALKDSSSLENYFVSVWDEVPVPSSVEYYKRKLHYQIALCYLLGRGTYVEELQALRYLASAALGGIRRAIYMYTAVEASTEITVDWQMPRAYFLCLGYMNGCTICADMLAQRDIRLYAIIKNIRWKLDLPLWSTICRRQDDAELLEEDQDTELLERYRLFVLIDFEATDDIRKLLESGSEITLVHETGITVLHALSLIDDEVAATLAPVLLQYGADLSAEALEVQTSSHTSLNFGWGTPIMWALVKSRPKLFAALLDWCIEAGIDIPAGTATIFLSSVSHREPEMLAKLVQCREHFKEEAKDMASDRYRLRAVRTAIEEITQRTIMRRWGLGVKFRSSRRAIAKLLVEMGISPLAETEREYSAVRLAIAKGDVVCLEVYLEALKQQGHDLLPLLSRTGIIKDGADRPIYMSAMYASVYAESREGLSYFIEHFPELIDEPNESTRTPLLLAICLSDHVSTLALIDGGADMYHVTAKGGNALVLALTHNCLDIADILMKKGDRDRLLKINHPIRTAFHSVLGTYMTGRKNISIESFQYLHRLGGLHFVLNENNENVWRSMLVHGRPFLEDHVSADIALLRFFLRDDVFGPMKDAVDYTGRTALHYAVKYGYLEAVELFIEAGAFIHAETHLAEDDGGMDSRDGITATDMALVTFTSPAPDRILAGGAIEIRSWQYRTCKILLLLLSYSGQKGSCAPDDHSRRLWAMKEPNTYQYFATHPSERFEDDETWKGKWPEKLPSDLSVPLDLHERSPQLQDDCSSEEGELAEDLSPGSPEAADGRWACPLDDRGDNNDQPSSQAQETSEAELQSDMAKTVMYEKLRIAQLWIAQERLRLASLDKRSM